jgi:hypothetical protein
MADISQELSAIKNSVYGKTMRTAIHDAIKKVNEDGGGGGSSVKTLTYTGTGSTTNTITFPETPTIILSIDGMGLSNGYVTLSTFRYGSRSVSGCYVNTQNSQKGELELRATVDGNSLTLSLGVDAGAVCNVTGETYTVVYI